MVSKAVTVVSLSLGLPSMLPPRPRRWQSRVAGWWRHRAPHYACRREPHWGAGDPEGFVLAVRPAELRPRQEVAPVGARGGGGQAGAGVPGVSGDEGRLGCGARPVRALRGDQAVGDARGGGVPVLGTGG